MDKSDELMETFEQLWLNFRALCGPDQGPISPLRRNES